jgi:predicted RNA binding protein YcfA (HicA-like mRNA interferase family)
MPKLPVISGDRCIRALEKYGYLKDHQKGSHMIMVKPVQLLITVPRHDELYAGLLRSIIRRSNLTVKQFIQLFEK